MQVSVVTTSMRRKVAMSSFSFTASPASCPMRSQCAKSMQRAFVVVGTAQRASCLTSFLRNSKPASPITSMSPIMWTLVTGTKRFAPQNLPTSTWYWSARLAASPRPPPRMDCSSAVNSTELLPLAGVGREVLGVLVGHFLPLVRVGRRGALAGDFRPLHRELGVQLEPLVGLGIGIGHDRLGRAFGLADAAVDALIRVDDEHVLALVEAVHGADFDAIHVLALDAGFGDDVGHKRDYRISLRQSKVWMTMATEGLCRQGLQLV